jgi:arsenate reductase
LGEGMLNYWAQRLGKDVRACSAGSAPSGRVKPLPLEVLNKAGVDTSTYHSRSWDEFARAVAPQMRIVITVCDNAATETCPYWPGSPVQVHWGYPEPSNAPGGDEGKREAFNATGHRLPHATTPAVPR